MLVHLKGAPRPVLQDYRRQAEAYIQGLRGADVVQRNVVSVVAMLLLAVFASGCSAVPFVGAPAQSSQNAPEAAASSVQGWIASDSTGVLFLRWTRSDPAVSGTLRVAQLDGEEVEATDVSFNGTISGPDVSLDLGGWLTPSLSGTLGENELTLLFPDESGPLVPAIFTPGTAADFNDEVRTLTAAGDQARADREWTEALTDAQNALGRAIDIADLRVMADYVTAAEEVMVREVETAIADLEATAASATRTNEVRYALDAVGFALDAVGYSVESAEGYGADRLHDFVANLDGAIGYARRAGYDGPMVGEAEKMRTNLNHAMQQARQRITKLRDEARDRWSHAAGVARSGGIEVGDRTGFGREGG